MENMNSRTGFRKELSDFCRGAYHSFMCASLQTLRDFDLFSKAGITRGAITEDTINYHYNKTPASRAGRAGVYINFAVPAAALGLLLYYAFRR